MIVGSTYKKHFTGDNILNWIHPSCFNRVLCGSKKIDDALHR
jgi:hypothetical protein